MVKDSATNKVDDEENRTFRWTHGLVVSWMLPTLSSLLIILLAIKLTNFYYSHAWASAHFATIAQSFAGHGIIGLRGIPIENFDPITTEPDNYLHWPPFFFYVLSLVIRIFPDSIRAMHLFMAAIAIVNAYVMWKIASFFFKPRAAIVCGSAFLLMPATLRYGLVLLPANLAILEVSVALLFMLRYLQGADAGAEKSRDLGISAFAFFLACITSWEPFLALLGLFLAYWIYRGSVFSKLCLCWAIAAMVAAATIFALYSLSDPTFFRDLWSIFTFRVGLTSYMPLTRIHPVEGQLEAIGRSNPFSSLGAFMLTYVVRTEAFCGSLGVLGIVALLLRSIRHHRVSFNKLGAALLLPLCTLWLAWAVVMQQHYAIHEYQLILATPLLAVAIAYIFSLLEDSSLAMQEPWLRENLAVLANLGLPFALLLAGISAAWITNTVDPSARLLADFGRRIETEVPAGAIVLTNEPGMVPTYYARRHVIRGIPNAAYLESHLEVIRSLCGTCQIYLALPRESEDRFHGALIHMQPVFADGHFIIKKLQ